MLCLLPNLPHYNANLDINMEDDVISKPLTAEERRQRRMKKILENSESRMSTILSGPDGG